MNAVKDFILGCIDIDGLWENLDKLYNINFVMLAFLITALSVLQVIRGGRIEDFKRAGIFNNVVKIFTSALSWNLFVGLFIFVVWLLKMESYWIKIILSIASLDIFFIALYKTKRTYKILAYCITMHTHKGLTFSDSGIK